MIYSIRAIVSQFSAMVTIMQRVIKRRKVARSNAKARRCPPSVPRLISIDYWCSPWGQLLRRFAAIDGGPSIASRDGKLFRRRFRVPYCVYCNLVQKCYDKNLYCENSSKEKDVTLRSLCPVENKLLSVLLGRNWNFECSRVSQKEKSTEWCSGMP